MTQRVLLVATVDSHIWAFHMPYLRLLRDMGYEVEVAAGPVGCAPLIEKEGFPVYSIHFDRNPLNPRNAKAYRELRRLLHERRYTMVHVHTPVAGFIGRLAAQREHVPHVLYTAHGFHFYRGGRWWSNSVYYALELMASRWTDLIITMNQEDYGVASRHFASTRTRVLYVPGVGVDCGQYWQASDAERSQARASLGLPARGLLVAWIGELIPRKQPLVAAEVAFTAGLSTDISMVMLGSGHMEQALRRWLSQRQPTASIILVGHVWNVADYLAAADAAIATPRQEGLPRNIMEAMSAGLPVVAFDIRGCRDLVVDGQTGFLVPPGDIHGMANELVWLAEHPGEGRRMGLAGRARIEQNFSLELVKTKMQAIYADVLKEDR